ncbi:unnamed protein product [Rotaria magnacalcarata]|uniref:Uncharacterized protein n=3 Tax=Rotaria magnacalcarata TaxID=392030 RepID=A0A815RX71_9BILA|nr:unnamed protein product [Rotaria magnacalcarata]CAF2077829.1 unnamed protein product [Rotaria magnacalcarata]
METKSNASWYHRWRTSRPVAVAITFLALFLDGILVTAIVPIMPDYLFKIAHCQVNREASNFESCIHNVSRNYTKAENEDLVTVSNDYQ